MEPPVKRRLNVRLASAFAIAPAVPCVLVALVATVGGGDLGVFLAVLALCATLTYPLALLAGIPAYIYLSRKGPPAFVRTAAAGACLGAILGVAFVGLFGSFHALLAVAEQALLYAVYGCVTASVFWLIALRKRTRHAQ
jgi:hypothetical protein